MAAKKKAKKVGATRTARAPAKGAAKKAAAPKATGATKKPIELPREKRRLPVPVGAEIVDRAAHEMAKLHGTSEHLKAERRETMAEFKERRAGIDQRMGELADTVNKSTALKEITCRVKLYVEENVVRVYREDTGILVEERAATAAERQGDLDMQVGEVKATSAAVTPFTHPQDLAPHSLRSPAEVGAKDPNPFEDEPSIEDGDEEPEEEGALA
jgi:hypothetical protein